MESLGLAPGSGDDPVRLGVDETKEKEEAARRFYYALVGSLGLTQEKAHSLMGLNCQSRSHKQPPGANHCCAQIEEVSAIAEQNSCPIADGWSLLATRLASAIEANRQKP